MPRKTRETLTNDEDDNKSHKNNNVDILRKQAAYLVTVNGIDDKVINKHINNINVLNSEKDRRTLEQKNNFMENMTASAYANKPAEARSFLLKALKSAPSANASINTTLKTISELSPTGQSLKSNNFANSIYQETAQHVLQNSGQASKFRKRHIDRYMEQKAQASSLAKAKEAQKQIPTTEPKKGILKKSDNKPKRANAQRRARFADQQEATHPKDKQSAQPTKNQPVAAPTKQKSIQNNISKNKLQSIATGLSGIQVQSNKSSNVKPTTTPAIKNKGASRQNAR